MSVLWACMKFSKNKNTNDSTTAEAESVRPALEAEAGGVGRLS